MLEELEMHVCSMAIQKINAVVFKRHVLLQDRDIPRIYYAYTMQKSLASLLSCPSALGSLGPGRPQIGHPR